MDLRLNLLNNVVTCDWYHKPTYSGRYLNFMSLNPMCHKIGTIYTIVDRAILLADLPHYQKNLEFCVILIANNYPVQFIFDTINKRLRKLFTIKLNNSIRHNESNQEEKMPSIYYFVLPYTTTINNHSKQYNILINNNNIQTILSYRMLNSLKKFIKTHNDNIPDSKKKNVVYNIQKLRGQLYRLN